MSKSTLGLIQMEMTEVKDTLNGKDEIVIHPDHELLMTDAIREMFTKKRTRDDKSLMEWVKQVQHLAKVIKTDDESDEEEDEEEDEEDEEDEEEEEEDEE